MSAPQIVLVSVLTAGCILLAGCQGKSKISIPSGPPTFEAILQLDPRSDGNLSTAGIAETLKSRTENLAFPVKIVPGPPGESRIAISLYAATEAEARAQLKSLCRSAELEIRKVHPKSRELGPLVAKGETIVPGYKHYEYNYLDDDGRNQKEDLLLSKRNHIEGKHLKQAWPDPARAGVINVTLTTKGGLYMRKLTTGMQKGVDRLAILLDGEVLSAPVVQDTLSRQFIIQGIHDGQEREDLCSALMAPLPVELTVESFRAHTPPAP